jgi:hypothetical protein
MDDVKVCGAMKRLLPAAASHRIEAGQDAQGDHYRNDRPIAQSAGGAD